MNKLLIKILGCGGSGGVPLPGCQCPTCVSTNRKNNRTRTSLYIETHQNKRILIDCGPDLRQQMLRENIDYFDIALLTHKHSDHIAGLDDLRVSFFNREKYSLNTQIECYGCEDTMNACYSGNFRYMFHNNQKAGTVAKPLLGKIINPMDIVDFEGMTIVCFEQQHGVVKSLGYLFPKFAYSTDLNEMPDESVELLKNAELELWIVSLTHVEGNNAHASLEKIKLWINYIKPERVIFTHMSHQINYDMRDYLPEKCEFGYDGMRILL